MATETIHDDSGAMPWTIADAVSLSDEVQDGKIIDGRTKLYHVTDEQSAISSPTTLFDRTLVTDALHTSLTALKANICGEDARGTHIFYGPYGSGKSHHMAVLYHLLDAPDVAQDWLSNVGYTDLATVLPENTTTVEMSMQNKQPGRIWSPIFDALDYDPEIENGGYPDIETLRDAIGNRTVAIYLDELEDWFATLDDTRQAASRGFLQALLEASDEADLDLFVFASVLRSESAIHDILGREDPVEINMTTTVDSVKIARHRLFDAVDAETVSEIVADYDAAYTPLDDTSTIADMEATYPFHPHLIEALQEQCFADADNQATRGMLYLLSQLVVDHIDDTALLTAADVDAIQYEDELSLIDRHLTDACQRDIERVTDEDVNITAARRILNTVLLYSFNRNGNEGVRRHTILTHAYHPQHDSLNDLSVAIERLTGRAIYLHQHGEKYLLRDAPNATTKIADVARDVPEREVRQLLADRVASLFGPPAEPVGFLDTDLPDSELDTKSPTVVVGAEPWDADGVRRVITNAGQGRRWRGSFVFVEPYSSVLASRLTTTARRFIAATQLLDGRGGDLSDRMHERISNELTDLDESLDSTLRQQYGAVRDGTDLLTDFDSAVSLPLDVFVEDGNHLSARNIVTAAYADPFEIESTIEDVIAELQQRRDTVTVSDILEHYRSRPALPLPADYSAIATALDATDFVAIDASGTHTHDETNPILGHGVDTTPETDTTTAHADIDIGELQVVSEDSLSDDNLPDPSPVEFTYEGDGNGIRPSWNTVSIDETTHTVAEGSLSYTTTDDSVGPAPDITSTESATTVTADISLTFDAGTSIETVADIIDNIPPTATDVACTIRFEPTTDR